MPDPCRRRRHEPFLPVELAGLIEKPYLGVFAETDDLIPGEDVERLRESLEDNPDAIVEVYEETKHAFFNDHRDAYHAVAADRA